MSAPKKVVLAYSGGLDTSIILKWLETEYGCEVVTFTADLGQGEELEPARAQGRAARREAREHLHRGPARGIRPRLRLPDVPRQRRLRGRLPARHLDRPPADRQAPRRDRRGDRRRRRRPRRHRQGQRPGPLRALRLRAEPGDPGHRPLAALGPDQPHQAPRVRRGAPDPDRQGQARRGPVLGRRQPPAHLVRGQGAGEPGRRGAPLRLSAHRGAGGRPRRPRVRRDRLREGRRRRHRRRAAVAGHPARPPQRARRPQRRRPARPRREPLRRHEVARHLRDPRRHRAARRSPRHRVRSPSTAAPRTSRTS